MMAADLTTADVYEDASLIGQDIEKIIERFGHDAMTDLMPKIIRVLEKLEIVVGEREKDKLEIAELKLENERLYLDIKREASQRRKLDEELYQLSSTGETDNLKTMLIKLQEENKQLRMQYEVTASTQPATAYISAPGDAELMRKMKETIDNQRDTIRSKNMEIDSLRNDLQAVEEQIERLTTINESVRKTLGASKARIHTLAKEKAELQTELRALRHKDETPLQSDESDAEDIEGFMESYSEQQEQNSAGEDEEREGGVDEETVQNSEENTEDVVALSNRKPPPKPPRLQLEGEENADVLNNNENNVGNNEMKIIEGGKENEMKVRQNGNDEEEANSGDWEIVGRTTKTAYNREKSQQERRERRAENQRLGRADKENKDPNRPRYTKAEMLEILTERNNLKERVFALQDELRIYKPGYAEEDEYGQPTRKISSPRGTPRREESGISRIFSIFTRKGDH